MFVIRINLISSLSMKKILFISLLLVSTSFFLKAQNAGNPFAEFGYNPPTATSSKGEFQEFHGLSEIVEIGSVKYNTVTKQIVGFVEEQKAESEVSSATTAMSVDPLCEQYYWITPYAYCLNNPVKFIDPDGREVRGLTKVDALNAQQDFSTMFSGDQFNNFRGLITLDKKGKTFNSISADALTRAFEGITLTQDQQALVNEFVGVINSKDIHMVEYANVDGTISAKATSALRNQINERNPGVGDKMIPAINMSGETLNKFSGGGINIPTSKGSHSVIMEGQGVNHFGGRTLTTGHEVIGHGPASASGASYEANNTRAIRVDNLIRRVMGLSSYPLEKHGGVIIINPSALP